MILVLRVANLFAPRWKIIFALLRSYSSLKVSLFA